MAGIGRKKRCIPGLQGAACLNLGQTYEKKRVVNVKCYAKTINPPCGQCQTLRMSYGTAHVDKAKG